MKNRKKIPNQIKETVRYRQRSRCACCFELGEHFHHVLANSRIFGEHLGANNIILLCKKHHELFHLGDPETYQMVYEYAWYIVHGYLPEGKDTQTISEEVYEYLKKSFKKEIKK